MVPRGAVAEAHRGIYFCGKVGGGGEHGRARGHRHNGGHNGVPRRRAAGQAERRGRSVFVSFVALRQKAFRLHRRDRIAGQQDTDRQRRNRRIFPRAPSGGDTRVYKDGRADGQGRGLRSAGARRAVCRAHRRRLLQRHGHAAYEARRDA
ncbi:hypothetical protein SDC9_138272 [bioreactor metagenome]|uniref:Uncharacterized protein n=1 Tax=bioreactor metagenome TaxID=1076179 RepID=A0A645DPC2_9ZZZZ